ncbi:hypothetical protein D1872_265760 [compost metagenome]
MGIIAVVPDSQPVNDTVPHNNRRMGDATMKQEPGLDLLMGGRIDFGLYVCGAGERSRAKAYIRVLIHKRNLNVQPVRCGNIVAVHADDILSRRQA